MPALKLRACHFKSSEFKEVSWRSFTGRTILGDGDAFKVVVRQR
jgi:hypothetical protein